MASMDRMVREAVRSRIPISLSDARGLNRWAVYPIVGLLVASMVLGSVLLFRIAEHQDRREELQSREFVVKMLEDERARLRRAMSDYASWGQAYRHLHVRFDFEWAFTQQNVGPSLFSDLNIDYLFLIDPSGKEIYSIDRGQLAPTLLSSKMTGDVDLIIKRAKNPPSEKSTTFEGVGFVEGDPVLIIASPITPGGDTTVEPIDGPASILVMGDRLDAETLGRLGRAAFIANLHTDPDRSDLHGKPHQVLASIDGSEHAVLRWQPDAPGAEMLAAVGPWALIGCGFVGLLVALLVRHAHRAVAAIEKKSDQLVQAHRDAEFRARHDEITGLLNRNGIREIFDGSLTSDEGSNFSLIFMDLDRFKLINDALGHEAGDFALREIGQRICGLVPRTAEVARLGGDEFAVLVRETDPARLATMCDEILRSISRPLKWGTAELGVGVSFGIASVSSSSPTYLEISRQADVALYQAKADGRGTHRFFSHRMNEHVVARQRLDRELRQAIRERTLEVHYQPLVDAASQRVVGAEALVRWPHPTRGMIPPNDFIPLAEETGLITDLGNLVLQTACRHARLWPSIGVSVNISPIQFRNDDFVDTVRDVISRTGIKAESLKLELTEAVLLDSHQSACAKFEELKRLGVRLSLDDFGSGYSSLNYLRMFPFDQLKIDRAFISDLNPSGGSRAIVRAIIGLGRSLGMEVVAEGVETIEQLLLLRADQCDLIQGYLTGRPMPEQAFRAHVGNAERQGAA